MNASDELPALPLVCEGVLGTPALLRKLRAERAITRVRTPAGDEAWLVTWYEEVRRLAKDRRLGVSHPEPRKAARISDSVMLGGPSGNFDTEEADHTLMRSRLSAYFTPKRMRTLRPRVEALAERLIDGMAARTPPVDLHQALSLPLPTLVICELLGVPYADRARFRAMALAMGDMTDRRRSEEGLSDVFAYTQHLLTRKRRRPGDDIISCLCTAEDGSISDSDIVYLVTLVLFAGFETIVVRIDYGVLLLLSDGIQFRALRERPEAVSTTVEEILRASMYNQWAPRYAREDIEVGGVTIRAGEAVVLDLGTANRDERVFAGSECLDIMRSPNPHLAFGHGPRYCIGAPLARIELEAVFARLAVRLPSLRLAVPVEEIRVLGNVTSGGLAELPVAW